MNGKRTLVTLTLIGLIVLVATTGCHETQVAAGSQPVAQVAQAKTPTLAPTPAPVVITVVVTPTPQPTLRAETSASPRPEGSVELSQDEANPPTPTPVAPAPTPIPAEERPTAKVTAAVGNVRSGPGLTYPAIGQVSQGDEVAVLKRDGAGDWLQIAWNDGPAWLSASLVSLNVAVTDLAVAESVTPPPTPASTTEAKVPYCDSVPIRGFGKVWGEHPEVAATLGCPGWPAGEQGTDAAIQTFEHGLILWLGADSSYDSDPVYVLFEDGEFQRFADLGAADPSVVGKVSDGFYVPGDRFSKIYWEGTGARVQERLGYATGPQVESPGAYQQFWNGRMFWAGTLKRIFVLYDYWQYDENGENGVQIRSWASFEDTFGVTK